MNRSSILKKFLTGVKINSHLVKISSTIKLIQEIHMSIYISRKKLKCKMSFLPPTIIWYLKLRNRTITKRNDENGIKLDVLNYKDLILIIKEGLYSRN